MNQRIPIWTLWPFWQRRAEFYRDLAHSIDDRELLRDFVDGELRIATNPGTSDRQKAAVLAYMRQVMDSGITSIDQVLQRIMPASDAMSLSVVADAKDKAASLRYVAENVERQKAMNAVVRSAISSPAILCPVAFVFAYVMAAHVIPAFEKSAPPEIWTGFAAFVRSAAFAFKRGAPAAVLLLVCVLVWFAVYGLANVTAPWRYRAENATGIGRAFWIFLGPLQPILALYRDIQGARMLANLATLLQAGRGLQDALNELSIHASPWMRKHLHWVVEHMQIHPGDHAQAFSHGLLSGGLLARLQSRVRRDADADFSRILVELGTVGQDQARGDVQRYAQQLNVLLLAGVLALILFFYSGQNYILFQIQMQMTPQAIQQRALQKKQRVSAISGQETGYFATHST